MSPIKIRGNAFDRNEQLLEMPQDASSTNYVLVQLSKLMDNSMVIALQGVDAEVIQRVTIDTWLVYYPWDDMSRLTSLTGILDAFIYHHHFVIAASLKNTFTQKTKNETSTGYSHLDILPKRLKVLVGLHQRMTITFGAVTEKLCEIMDSETITIQHKHFLLEATYEQLRRISRIEEVEAIEPVLSCKFVLDSAVVIAGISKVNHELNAGGYEKLQGRGQVVAIVDSGLDRDHPAFLPEEDKIVSTNFSHPYEHSLDDYGHGTHISGVVLGRSTSDGSSAGIAGIAGMAPEALVVVEKVAVHVKDLNIYPFFNHASRAKSRDGRKCRIINNSWGPGVDPDDPQQHPYGLEAVRLDEWARIHPEMLVVWAAGNDGNHWRILPSQIGTYAAAKNVLTVGATFTDKPVNDQGQVFNSSISVTKMSSRAGTIVPASSKGPVLDSGRQKPDVVAPGGCILSARSSMKSAQVLNKALIEQYLGKDANWTNEKYIYATGTSVAAATASGCAALLREALELWCGHTEPSAPLMKALMINGAIDLGKSRDAQGFGELNLEKMLIPLLHDYNSARGDLPVDCWFHQGIFYEEDFDCNRSFTKTVTVPQGKGASALNFKITLVYHDKAGVHLENEIALTVTQAGDDGNYQDQDSLNINNVQQVSLKSVTEHTKITINVTPEKSSTLWTHWALAWTFND